jgi:hypothetical protein
VRADVDKATIPTPRSIPFAESLCVPEMRFIHSRVWLFQLPRIFPDNAPSLFAGAKNNSKRR